MRPKRNRPGSTGNEGVLQTRALELEYCHHMEFNVIPRILKAGRSYFNSFFKIVILTRNRLKFIIKTFGSSGCFIVCQCANNY